jgi:hypothetical protein
MSRSQKISAKIKSLIQKEKEDQSPESKLPWILAISSKLKENAAAAAEVEKKTIAFDDEMEDRKYQEPREPENPRPTSTKGMQKQQLPAKKLIFHAYRASHPELLESLNSIVEKGLEELTKLYPPEEMVLEDIAHDERKDSSQQQFTEIKTNKKVSEKIEKQYELYSYVFQHFINESTIYQKLLRDVRSGYEDYITDLITQLAYYEQQNLTKAELDSTFNEKVGSIEKQYKDELITKQQLITEQENTISSLQSQINKLRDDTKQQRDHYHTMKKEYDDLKASCQTLTAGLTRLEDDNRLYQTNETNRLVEMSLMKMSEQKLNEEIER